MAARRGPVLVLGGTGQARALATTLHEDGVPAITSLAGRLTVPRLPEGEHRIGGFGATEGLARWLTEEQIVAVVDATHPFAAQISEHAANACRDASVPLLRLVPPPWHEQPGDRWHRVKDVGQAAVLVPGLGRRVLLTLGRQRVGAFTPVEDCCFLIRCIEAPDPPLPPHHEVLLDRGPYTLEGELALLRRHQIDVLVTRNSGGAATEAKLYAARRLGLPVIVIERPPAPDAPSVSDVGAALAWVRRIVSAR